VISKDVPPGIYLIFGAVTVTGFGDTTYRIDCRIEARDASGGATLYLATGLFDVYGNLNLQAAINPSFGVLRYTIDCATRNNGVAVMESSLIAIRLDSLQ
jgi:hypothetical protein